MKENVTETSLSALMHSMEEIVLLGFCRITQRLSGVHLQRTEDEIFTKEPVYSGIIKIHGLLDGQMLFVIPKTMAEQIVFQMNHRRELPEAEKEGYFREYLNIVAGCTMTGIGNFLGRRMRFSVPAVVDGICKEIREEKFQYRSRHDFSSELGSVLFILEYDGESLDKNMKM